MKLTKDEYENLWNFYFKELNGVKNVKIKKPPSYNDYCLREDALEDYLDIFRGTNTRSKRKVNPLEPHPYKDLVEDKNDKNDKKDDKNNLEIKYVLIAEAAPPPKNGTSSLQGSYIYRDAKGHYITSPLKAFNEPIPKDSTQRLIKLAEQGILIMDLFPFAIEYGNIRDELNNNKITDLFFNDNKNIYSIVNRLQYMINSRVRFNLANPSSAFIAPGVISNYLGKLVQNPSTNTWKLIFQSGFNTNYSLCSACNNVDLQNNLGNTYSLGKKVLAPIFSCCAHNGARNPDYTFLKSALNII